MKTFTKSDLVELVKAEVEPAVSIYIETDPNWPEREQSPIKLKNAIKEVKQILQKNGADEDSIKKMLRPVNELIDNDEFWKRQSSGLAIFLSKDQFFYYRVPVKVENITTVSSTFYVKPLIPLVTESDRYYILDLSLKSVRFFEVAPPVIRQIDFPEDVKTNIEDLIEFGDREDLQVHSGGGGSNVSFYGDFYTDENKREDIKVFFRQIDEFVSKHLKDQDDYLVLVGVAESNALYREIAGYKFILDDELRGSWDHLGPEELREKTDDLVAPHFEQNKRDALANFRKVQNTDKALTGLKAVIGKALSGRVDTLFIKKGVVKWGTFNTQEFHLNIELEQTPDNYDLLNFAAVNTLLNNGKVYLLDEEEVKDDEYYIFATLRY
jgi:hypothetical protein